jgi:glycine/D-amino acid oxidase-like deaminating enzyme
MRAEVIVVGGGVMGTAIAWYAAQRSDPLTEPVLLLEKKELAAGSSGRSGAILRQFYSDRVVAAMARDSLRVYATLEARTGRSIAFQPMGVVTLAGPDKPDDVELVRRNVAMQIEIGIDTRLVDAAEIRRLVPGIAVQDGTVGAYEPGGGGVDPVRTVNVFATLAREQGACVRTDVTVTGFVVRNGRIEGVETNGGRIDASTVVVAAGPWTRALFAPLGIELPLRVVRPEQHFLQPPVGSAAHRSTQGSQPGRGVSSEAMRGAAPAHGVSTPDAELDARFADAHPKLPPAAHPVLLDLEHGFYTRCESHANRTRVGHMDYTHDSGIVDPERLDETVSAEFKRWAHASLARRLPVYAERKDAGSTVGMYTVSPDAQALIGQVGGIGGLFVVSGFSGHGFKLAPSIGEGVTQMIRGEPVSAFDTAFFAPQRFATAGARAGRAFGL